MLDTPSVSHKNLIKIVGSQPEHASLEDPVCHLYVCSFVAQFLPGRMITLCVELLLGSKLSSTSHCLSPLCVSTGFWALRRPFGRV